VYLSDLGHFDLDWMKDITGALKVSENGFKSNIK